MRPSIYLKNLQSASNWRAQYNPLRGLTLPLLVGLLEQGERGDYARLQWLYRFIEKRNPTLRAVLQRRQSSLTKLDWNVSISPGAGSDPRALGARQAAVLRMAYARVENLREAVAFLALAEFRGYAHLERHVDAQGRTIRLQPVPQWFWARLGPEAPWQYNATARPGLPMPGDPVLDPARFLYREVPAPIDEIAAIAHVRQALSQKDWDAFVETYALPPLFLELPADIPAEREAEYQAQAEAIIGDARGTVPHGTGIHTVDSGARGQNPFAEHLRYQDELIVLAATGGKLTALTESGSGTLAGSAHQQTFDDLAEAEAGVIAEIFQRQFDAPLLDAHFPGEPAQVPVATSAGDHAAALAAAKPSAIDTSLDPRSAANIATLLPAAQRAARRLLAEANDGRLGPGNLVKVICGTRSYAEQTALYNQGRITPGPIVTDAPAGYSNHNFGIAFDVGIFKDGVYLADSPHYLEVGALGRSQGLEWGGDFREFPDVPHFQLPYPGTLAEARAASAAGSWSRRWI